MQDAEKGRPARPQRAKRRRRTLRYVELLSEARTPLADFFSILLKVVRDAAEEIESAVHSAHQLLPALKVVGRTGPVWGTRRLVLLFREKEI
jgi:acetolactate synthase small subunit